VNIRVMHLALAAEHDVFMATSGEQALGFCAKTPPDIVLLDVEMPGLNGLEVCRRLKQDQDTQSIPIIFVTSHQGQEEETACWEAGGVDFVSKPVNPLTLRKRVNSHLTLKFQADLLREMAFIDGLTGVANRRFFDERLGLEWRRGKRSGSSLALILADVDHFKKYNDHYGHLAGDDCLRMVATALKQVLKRPADLAARYGGEEFVCLLPDTDLDGAITLAGEMAAAVRALGIEHVGSKTAPIVTVSLGVAAIHPRAEEACEALVQSADAELYRAKQLGRDRWCAHTGTGI
jgi:diguanylate cyclase (GGDEF)-like protein